MPRAFPSQITAYLAATFKKPENLDHATVPLLMSAPWRAFHDLSFITDTVLQEMIGLDLSAVATDLQSGERKGATIIAGSCCEALLLYGLQTREAKKRGAIAGAVGAITWPSKPPKASDLTDRSWDLFSYTEVAHKVGLISGSEG